jgi:hypothetical protein
VRGLFASAQRVERDDWSSGVNPAPAYRYVDARGAKTEPRSLREALGLPSLVQAKKPKDDDPGGMLVYGADGKITGLELVHCDHQEVWAGQRIMRR